MEEKDKPIFALSREEFLELLTGHKEQQIPKHDPHDEDDLLTLAEVRQLFKKTRQTIRNWVKKYYINCAVVGGSNYYSKKQIETYMQSKIKGFAFNKTVVNKKKGGDS